MKYCNKAYDFVHIDWNGNVYLCAWTYIKIGNLLEDDLETIWNSHDAQLFRKSIEDGSYKYCMKHTCPHCNNDSLPDLNEEEFKKAIQPLPYPTKFELSHDYICNHKCPSCRHEIFKPDEKYAEKMRIIHDKLLPYLNKAEFIDACGNGDMFSSPYIMELFSKLRPENSNLKLNFETNGVLFDEEHWERIKYLTKYDISVVVTPNSYERLTYKYLTGGIDNLHKLLSSMEFISKLRKENKIKQFRVSMVVQDRNYTEVPSFIDKTLNEFGADEVIVKPVYPWFELTAEEYWFKDILNPMHPYHKEYLEILETPICKDHRVFYWGANDIHDKADHPYIKYKYYWEYCLEFMNSNCNRDKIINILKTLGSIAIYGAGRMGKFLYDYVEGEIEIQCFIDRYTREREYKTVNIKRFFANDFSHIDTIIVTPVMESDEIKKVIYEEGFKGTVVDLYELIK